MKDMLHSSNIKLCYHIDNIRNIKTSPQPIDLVIAVTSRCNLCCKFCYVKNKPINDLDIEKVKHFIDVVNPKSIEITGGEPTIYKNFEELVCYISGKGIDIGMTTNGTMLHTIPTSVLAKFTWIRISINEYIDNGRKKDFILVVKSLPNVYWGYNYIFTSYLPHKVMTMMYDNVKYCRVTLDINADDATRDRFSKIDLPARYFKVEIPKPTDAPKECLLHYVKPLLESDGYVYRCFRDVEDFKKDDTKAYTDIDHPEKLLTYVDEGVNCKKCYNAERINFINNILNGVTHKNFI